MSYGLTEMICEACLCSNASADCAVSSRGAKLHGCVILTTSKITAAPCFGLLARRTLKADVVWLVLGRMSAYRRSAPRTWATALGLCATWPVVNYPQYLNRGTRKPDTNQ